MSLAARMTALAAELDARYPARIVTRDLQGFERRKKADLAAGVYTLVSLGEGNYRNYNGREAMDGKHRMLLVGQIQLDEKAAPSAVEDAEFAMVEEVQALMRSLPASLCSLVMTGFRQSGQIDAPYGWVAIDLEFNA